MINIVIPMAGAGSRFAKEGYADPKPLIKINGIPMIQVVIENLKSKIDGKFFFICQEEHVIKYGLKEKLNSDRSLFFTVKICIVSATGI